jgi:hypothetical protein
MLLSRVQFSRIRRFVHHSWLNGAAISSSVALKVEILAGYYTFRRCVWIQQLHLLTSKAFDILCLAMKKHSGVFKGQDAKNTLLVMVWRH